MNYLRECDSEDGVTSAAHIMHVRGCRRSEIKQKFAFGHRRPNHKTPSCLYTAWYDTHPQNTRMSVHSVV